MAETNELDWLKQTQNKITQINLNMLILLAIFSGIICGILVGVLINTFETNQQQNIFNTICENCLSTIEGGK